MAEVVVVLTTCWKLARAINEIVSRVEQTREDARALTFLESQARSFLVIVNEGLVGVETSPYLATIVSLEGLLHDILKITNAYFRMNTFARFLNANQTRRTILNLNGRLRLFVDTYLLQTTTQAARVNLETLSGPVPVFDPDQPQLIPDDVQWEVMSSPGSAITAVDRQARITTWMGAVEEEPLGDMQSNPVVDTEPARTEMIYPPQQRTVRAPKVPGQLHICCHNWYRNVLCCPIRFSAFVADSIGRCCLIGCAHGTPREAISRHANDPGCCTDCIFDHFPLCLPGHCMTKLPGLGVGCVDEQCHQAERGYNECCSTECECIVSCVLCPVCQVMSAITRTLENRKQGGGR